MSVAGNKEVKEADVGIDLSVDKAEDNAAEPIRCACLGVNLEKFMQPIILHSLVKQPDNGYGVCKRIGAYATFEDRTPDMSATYRYLKNMKKKGYLHENDGVYSLSSDGRNCLENWRRTLLDYRHTLSRLSEQLSK
ncbi:MAG: PadR family transcriptional regulator [Fastidiosipilaceae bacterium]|jgi:PadR family transcriptional regulator PadR